MIAIFNGTVEILLLNKPILPSIIIIVLLKIMCTKEFLLEFRIVTVTVHALANDVPFIFSIFDQVKLQWKY